MSFTRFFNPAHYGRYAIRKLYFTKYNSTRNHILAQLLDARTTNTRVTDLIRAPGPALVGRMGGTETQALSTGIFSEVAGTRWM